MTPQGLLPRSPLGGVELPQTIKLTAGGCFQGNICFEPTQYYKKPIMETYLKTLPLMMTLQAN